jgi:hypothetical protein
MNQKIHRTLKDVFQLNFVNLFLHKDTLNLAYSKRLEAGKLGGQKAWNFASVKAFNHSSFPAFKPSGYQLCAAGRYALPN